MAFFPDLSETTMIDAGPHIRAIGWLDDKHVFPTGKAPAVFLDKLREITDRSQESQSLLGWDTFFGFHTCELCNAFHHGNNIGVPAGPLLYVAPAMVLHYVEGHSYLPPSEFIDAVLESPIPGTVEYRNAVASFGELHDDYQWRQYQEYYKEAARLANQRRGPILDATLEATREEALDEAARHYADQQLERSRIFREMEQAILTRARQSSGAGTGDGCSLESG